jgi:hypothetical protein
MANVNNNDPVSSISSVDKGLRGLNTQVDKLVGGLKKVQGLAGVTFGSVKQILGMNMGQGSGMNLGTSNATFSQASGGAQNVMPWAYSKSGAATIGGIQLGLGVAGGAYAAIPDLGMTVSRASGFYGAATRAPGMTRAGLAAATFSALKGGITGMGEDAAAAAMLAQGYNILPGTASFTQAMNEVGGAARAFNMPNATAAAAIGGLHTGSMGGNLYQLGISTYNTKTGETRGTEDIAKQLYKRLFRNQKGLTAKDIAVSVREGFAGAELTNLGFDTNQKELMIRAFTAFSQGQGFDLANMTGADNPSMGVYQMNTSATSLMERGTEAELKGLGTAADAITRLNKSLEGLPDAFFSAKAAVQAFSNSGPGAGISSIVGGIAGAAGTIAVAAGARTILGKAATSMGAKTVAETAARTAAQTAGGVAVKGGAMALGRAVPVIGGVVSAATGQGFLSTVGIGAAAAGVVGAVTTGGAAAVPAAIGGGILSGLGWLGAKAISSMFGGTSANAASLPNSAPVSTAGMDQGLIQTLQAAGFSGQGLITAYGVAMAESGGNAKIHGDKNLVDAKWGESIGLFQIRSLKDWKKYNDPGRDASKLEDPNYNAKVAFEKSKGGTDWGGWTTYTSGAYKNYVNGATGTASDVSTSGQTVNISLTIDKASDAEAIAFAKKIKDILLKDKSLNTVGSK